MDALRPDHPVWSSRVCDVLKHSHETLLCIDMSTTFLGPWRNRSSEDVYKLIITRLVPASYVHRRGRAWSVQIGATFTRHYRIRGDDIFMKI